MAVRDMFMLLLLLLPVYNNTEVILVKTSGKDPLMSPICSMDVIKRVECSVRTEKNNCFLVNIYEMNYEHRCDPRFKLMDENQTVFLRLTSLTPVDTGIYSCECSGTGGTSTLQLNVTVEEEEDVDDVVNLTVVLVPVSVVVCFAAFLLVIWINRRNIRNICMKTHLDLDDPDDPYTSLQLQPISDLYEKIPSTHQRHDAVRNKMDDGRETDIYDNI